MFTRLDVCLWLVSVACVTSSYLWFGEQGLLSLVASLVGVTSLICIAKGHPIGQVLMVGFSLLYGLISYETGYYGEVATYVGMTCPMAFFSFVSWMKNRYSKSEVRVHELTRQEVIKMCMYTLFVTVVFYYILRYFNTQNLGLSTVSVATSFMAVYLTYCRSPYYALGYACNDLVLIGLWILAFRVSMVVCFSIFFMNDCYGYYSWKRMYNRQKGEVNYVSKNEAF